MPNRYSRPLFSGAQGIDRRDFKRKRQGENRRTKLMTYHDTRGAMRPKLSLRYGACHAVAASPAPPAMIPPEMIPSAAIPTSELRRLVASMVD